MGERALRGGCSHLNPRTIGSLWSSGKGRILQEGRINACLVATVRSFVHQAQTPHLKESRTKKAADRIIRGLFSLLTTYGTKNHPERILNCFSIRRTDLVKDETLGRRDAFKICSSTVLFKRCCRMRPSLCPVNIAEIFPNIFCFSRACKFCRRHLKCRGCPDDIFNFWNKIIEGEDLATVLRRFFCIRMERFLYGRWTALPSGSMVRERRPGPGVFPGGKAESS